VNPRFNAAQIREYYDRHTPAFVAFGQRGSDGAIHRAVWGPGTHSRREAFRYVEDRIADAIARLAPSHGALHVVDLGCGVAASLCYLAARLPSIRGTGITVSPVQARIALERIHAAGCAARVRCLEGDYCDLPAGLEPADLAYAIESFVHGAAPDRFFAECRRIVRSGGVLVICDDFRRSTDDPAAARAIERFRSGWHVNTLLHRDELRALARDAGFERESTTDLSSYLEIGRARDRAAELLLAVARWLPWTPARLDYLLGGSALQASLARGWIGYDLVVFRRLV